MADESTALARRRNDAVDVLRQKYESLQKRDLEVVRGMNRFADLPTRLEDPDGAQLTALLLLPDVELAARGWSRRELRMAAWGQLPKAKWPASMQAAHERVGMRLRRQNVQPSKMQFNLNMLTIPAPKPARETEIVVLPEDPEE